MINEFVYCPRLFYLEWVDDRWADNADTAQGQARHRSAANLLAVAPRDHVADRGADVQITSVRKGHGHAAGRGRGEEAGPPFGIRSDCVEKTLDVGIDLCPALVAQFPCAVLDHDVPACGKAVLVHE